MSGGTQHWGSAAPLVLWLIVVAADAIFAGLPGLRMALALPLGAVAGLGRWFDARLNRARRSEANRRIRGAIVAVFVALLAWFAGAALADLAQGLRHGWLIEAAVLLCLIGQRRVIDDARRVAAALDAGDLDAARAALRPLIRFDTATLDGHGVARAAVEACASRLAEGVVGVAFWYALLGLPGVCAVRAVNILAQTIGRPSPRQAAFGFAARRLDDALTLIPAVIAGALYVIAAAFAPSANPVGALTTWLADMAARAASAAGRAEGAFAGALGLSLGGPRPYDDQLVPGGWVGDGRARALPADIRRAVLLATVATLIFAALFAAVVASRLV